MLQINYLRCKHMFVTVIRWQHNLVSAQASLPKNLVLMGKAKERLQPLEKSEPSKDIIPEPSKDVPVIRKCVGNYSPHRSVVKVWVDTFANNDVVYERAAELNPEVFAAQPRIDLLHDVVSWQKVYREVDYAWTRTRAELGRGRKKPWPQKKTGRVRQGSTAAPFWKKGGIAHGPRGPKSLYYEMPVEKLIRALTIALTIKRVQNDLVIVEDVDLPMQNNAVLNDDQTAKQETCTLKLKELLESRNMDKNSILFVHGENTPQNLHTAVEMSRGWNIMPLIGLNVLSILKHDKLVVELGVIDELEEKVLWNRKRYPWLGMAHNFYTDMPINQRKLEQSFAKM